MPHRENMTYNINTSKQWYLVARGNLYPSTPIITSAARGWMRVPNNDDPHNFFGDHVVLQVNRKWLCNEITTCFNWIKEIVPLEKVLPRCLPLEIMYSIGEYL